MPRIAKGYDRGKLDAAGLRELAHLLAESEDPAGALAAGKEYVGPVRRRRSPKSAPRVRRLMAECALASSGQGGVDEAIGHFQASLTADTPAGREARRARPLDPARRDRPQPAREGGRAPAAGRRGGEGGEARRRDARRLPPRGDRGGRRPALERQARRRARRSTTGPRSSAAGSSPGRSAPRGSAPTRTRSASSSTAATSARRSTWSTSGTRRSRPTSPTARPSSGAASCCSSGASRRRPPATSPAPIGLAPGALVRVGGPLAAGRSRSTQPGKPDEARRELAKLVASGINDPFARLAREDARQEDNDRRRQDSLPGDMAHASSRIAAVLLVERGGRHGRRRRKTTLRPAAPKAGEEAPKGFIKPGARTSIPNGDFEAGTITPTGWQTVDGLSSFWVKDDDPAHGKVIKFDTDVLQSQGVRLVGQDRRRRLARRRPAQAAHRRAQVRHPRRPRRRLVLERLHPGREGEGVLAHARREGAAASSPGWSATPRRATRPSAPTRRRFRKCSRASGPARPPTPTRKREVFVHKYVWKGQLAAGGSTDWKTYSRRNKPFRPTSVTPNVRYVRVMIYPFWPPGEYSRR